MAAWSQLRVGDRFRIDGALAEYRVVSEPQSYSLYTDSLMERNRLRFSAEEVCDGWGRTIYGDRPVHPFDVTAGRQSITLLVNPS